ncbi:HdeD family acid-resistance protein [Hongsoonwoonella zoysiae]|uniref:HdeD family acid-resistance protein n=1 Tax=Hongsoonwoonella zoysiae TaxID=2821844 RepID=UPI001FE40451|nr:HdeD family acid-resistance protein [Hongsoonwoonella zoysiae]
MTNQADANMQAQVAQVTQTVREKWAWFLVLGIVLVICGLMAIALPFATTIAVALVIAAVLLIGGAVQVWQSFSVQGWGGFLWQLITGIVAIVGGILIYANPVFGAFALTLVVAAVFVAQGITQLILGFRLRPHDGWGWIVAGGIISLLAGIMIWAEFPFSGTWALGILAGFSIAFNGWSYIAIALAGKRMARG